MRLHPRQHFPDPSSGLRIFIAAEGDRSFAEACGVHGRLLRQLGNDWPTSTTWWTFRQLPQHDPSERAAGELAGAHLVFLAIEQPRPLPPAVALWFEHWLPRGAGSPRALAALVGVRTPPTDEPAPHAYLRQLANENGMAFMPGWFHFGASPRFVPATTPIDDLRTLWGARWPSGDAGIEGGINE